MTQKILQVKCPQVENNSTLTNISASFPLLTSILHGCLPVNVSSLTLYIDVIESDQENDKNADFGALMYIVTVLLLYSCGIFFMIMKNLKREKHELEEERTLDDFFRGIPVTLKEREQVNVNRVAIQAFCTMTSSKLHGLTDMEDSEYYQQKPKTSFVDTILEDEDEDYENIVPETEDYETGSDSDSDLELSEDDRSHDECETRI